MKTRILMFYFFILSLMTGADVFAAVDVTLKSADDVAVQHDFDLDIYMSGDDEVAIFRIYLEFDNAEIQITGFTSHVGDELISPSVSACNETGGFVLLYSSPNPFTPLPEKKVLTISCKTMNETGVAGFRFFGRTYVKSSGFPPERVTGVLTGKAIRIVPQPPMYKITASASPSEGGSISNAGEKFYEAGETPEYEITVNEGYEIIRFTVTSDLNAKLIDNLYSFLPIAEDAVISVFFEKLPLPVISASASPAEGGKIEPSGNVSVNIGADQTFSITANAGWRVENVTVDGTAATPDSDGTYTFENVDKNHSIAAVFAKESIVVPAVINASATPAEGGQIEPSGNVSVSIGADQTFSITANPGWRTGLVMVDGSPVPLASGEIYRFSNVAGDHSISVVFTKEGTVIIASVSPEEGGKIEPSGRVSLDDGTIPTFRVTANAGWRTESVTVDGSPVTFNSSGGIYTFGFISGNHTITAYFEKESPVVPAIISASAAPAEGGQIEPSGNVSVNIGADQTFKITANAGWRIESLTVDGTAAVLSSDGIYTFENVDKNHSIATVFAKESAPVPAVINASATPAEGGRIEPSRDVVVTIGTDRTFTVIPNDGWRIETVTVDGMPVTLDADNTYTFKNIQKNHIIKAFFIQNDVLLHTITASASPAEGGSIEPSGNVTVEDGKDQIFQIIVNTGWEFVAKVDGNLVPLDSDSTYTFENVHKDFVFTVNFVKKEEKFHSADYDRDFHIGLRELIRVLQFYEFGGYHCDADTEDGYAPLGDGSNCEPHDSDYDNPALQSFQNWKIELGELLRLVQFYNSDSGYRPDPSGEDGFVLGD